MTYSYNREASVDPSILGYTAEQLAGMEPAERLEACIDGINRAADMVQQVLKAFDDDLSTPSKQALKDAIRHLVPVARKLETSR